MSGQLLKLTHDLVFQELFGKQKNKDTTAHLLSLILNREIKNIDLDVNKRMLGNRKNSKTGRLDIRAKFNDGEDCNIELQVEPFPFMDKRMLEYWGSMYDAKINSGDLYNVLKPNISIMYVSKEEGKKEGKQEEKEEIAKKILKKKNEYRRNY